MYMKHPCSTMTYGLAAPQMCMYRFTLPDKWNIASSLKHSALYKTVSLHLHEVTKL